MDAIGAWVVGSLLHTLTGWFTVFWGWILAGGAMVLGFLFSPTIRLYTIAAIAIIAILGSVWFFGFTKGQASVDICHDFFKMVGHKGDTTATLREMGLHNQIGAKLKCWSN